jgi:hypothetical protein
MANRKKYKSNPKMEVVPVDEVLSEFAFDQVTTLTNRLLKSQVLRTDEIMHVVHSFIHATRTACEAQLCTHDAWSDMLADCAIDLITEYCDSCRE